MSARQGLERAGRRGHSTHHLSAKFCPAIVSADTPVTATAVASAAAKPMPTSVPLLISAPRSTVEMLCRARRDRQVFGCPPRPFCRVANWGFPQVQDRDAGTDQGSDALVEGDQHRGRGIVRA